MINNLQSEQAAYAYVENFIKSNIKNVMNIKKLNNGNTCSFLIDQTSLSNISKGIVFPTSLFRGFAAPKVKNGKIFDASNKNPSNSYASSFFQKLIDDSLLSAVTNGNNNQFVVFTISADVLNKFTGNYGVVQTCYFEISFYIDTIGSSDISDSSVPPT
jgi:hypothetical protein